ncbi:sulfotransferase [Tateyamaria omphalii]|uniref:sulfotransferase n=1 Tax=Tateyamaria omphalii TaxID=299262 RepID=UPI001C9A112D|nr:sulfotransferase [Tateyamaria omphalii]MBY5935548.1 sulfotransferase [Tateyamaria omphalii]
MSEPGPDFLCIGMQKSGTHWLYHRLRGHPDFCMLPRKELQFFGRPFPSAGKKAGLMAKRAEWLAAGTFSAADQSFTDMFMALERRRDHPVSVYRDLFSFTDGRLSGDITPFYASLSDDQIAQIRADLGDIPVLMLVRDPVARVWSALNDGANKGKVADAALRTPDALRAQLARPAWAGASFPAASYRRWSQHFDVKVFFFDDVLTRPVALRDEIVTHLGGRPGLPMDAHADENVKAGRLRLEQSDGIKAELRALFGAELRDCAQLFGGPALHWGAQYGIT